MTTPCKHHRISFVCVNDVYAFDDVDNAGTPRGGWCRAATLMKRLRRQKESEQFDDGVTNPSVLTVVNGDVLGGSSLLVNCQGSVAIDCMNSIPIDLAVLGNHEFDYGDEVLVQRVKESTSTWLGSNVYYSPGNPPPGQTSQNGSNGHGLNYFPGIHGNGRIYNLSNNLKLGVFGLVTKLTPKISSPSDKVTFDPDVITVARRTSEHLRAQGAQVIVAITHLSEKEDRLLAADRLAGLDLILGGHEHEPLASMIHRNHNEEDGSGAGEDEPMLDGNSSKHNDGGVLLLKCGMNGYWVGCVDLHITQENDNVTSISTSYEMKAVNSLVPEDKDILSIVKKQRKETEERAMILSFGEEIASTISLDDVISSIGGGDGHIDGSNNGSNASILPLDTRMSSVRRREATGGNLVADAMHWVLKTQHATNNTPLPMLAMINGGFIRGDRVYNPGSKLTVREILAELPFPRTMKVLEIDGLHLRSAMAQQLRGSSVGPTGAYPHLSSNARLVYRSGGTSEEQIEVSSFSVDGLEISEQQKYLIAVTCFVAGGNEGCTSWLKSRTLGNRAWNDVHMSCILLKYLQSHPVICPVLEDRVKLQK